jgi:colanic acid/amylovoran biosynthesis glycosyltransferase
MSAADDKRPTQESATARPAQVVDRLLLDALRRREGHAIGDSTAWTACSAPANVLVIGADGATSVCDYAPLEPRTTPLGDAFDEDGRVALRAELARGRLPESPCGACAAWLRHGLTAPPVRDYGALPAEPAVGPRRLVLHVPPSGELPAAVLAALPDLVAHCDRLDLVAEHAATPALAAVRAALADTPRPRLGLRLRRCGDADPETWAGFTVEVVECTIDGTGPDEAAALATFAAGLRATAQARFVFTPSNWHTFDVSLAACTAAGVPMQLRLFDRGSRAPLADLRSEDLAFVRAALGSDWHESGKTQQPDVLPPQAIAHAAEKLRHVLRERAAAEAATAELTTVPLSLPGPGHAWFERPQPWWLTQLFGHGHLEAVRTWLVGVLVADGGDLAAPERTWLRVLAQRIANDHHDEAALEALRRLYADDAARKTLVRHDAAFAASFDLTRFGGPWSDRLGLAHAAKRRRPFALKRAVPPGQGAADMTVLIPSFRHEQFIEETLRSVLAQAHAGHRILVADDRSPDQTAARARAVDDPRIEVVVHDENLGLGNSVLRALELVDTPYVALLNSDDLFHPQRLERCREVLERRPDVQLVTTGMWLVDGEGGQLTTTNASLVLDGKKAFDWVHWFARVTPPDDLPQDQLFGALLERNFLVTSSNIVARTDWLRRQAESLRSLKYCLDWRLFLQAALEGALHHIHEPLLAYRLHATNTVWFHEGRRWSYYLEVNRVAAEALQRFLAEPRLAGDERLLRAVDAVTRHLTTNTEMDGVALFLNATVDPVRLDEAAARSEAVQQLVADLNTRAERLRALEQAHAAAPATGDARRAVRGLLDRLAHEFAGAAAERERWLVRQAEDLAQQVDRLRREREHGESEKGWLQEEQRRRAEYAARLEREKESLYEDQKHRMLTVQELETRLRAVYEDQARRIEYTERLEAEKQALLDDQKQRIEYARRLEAEKVALYDDQKQRIARVDDLETRLRAAYDDIKQRIGRIEEFETRLRALYDDQKQRIEYARRLEAEKAALYEDQKQRIETAKRLDAEHAAARVEVARLRSAHQETTTQLELTRKRGNELQAILDTVQRELEGERAELAASVEGLAVRERQILDLHGEREKVLTSLVSLERTHREIEHALADERTAHAAARSRIDELDAAITALEGQLATESAQVRTLTSAKESLTAERNDLVGQVAKLREEIARLLGTREFRTGNFLWNKLPLGYMSRRGKKWYRRLLDAKDRASMWFKKGKKAQGTAIVAACWQWPIYSHTFVYQEMVSLRAMGLDVRLFHWELGDTEQLHSAFRYLYDNRTQLQPVWDNHVRDKEHFERTRPGRLRSFLERIAPLCGKSVEQLEKEPIVLQGCTFARMAELAGARYLHSYFFYDQSFMTMQAAWLLDLPRGVSCYADHMMDDYPFKFVPLHVELCDVVVATSARIKRELSQLSGGRFDDKIIVKPNGVDGERFSARKRPVRQQGEPFEVLSVSRIEPKKGLIHLVEAIALLKRKGHRVIAHVIGSKDPYSKGSVEYAAEFERCIEQHGLQDQVILHGMMRQEQMPPIIERCRAFVAPYVETASGDKDGIPTAMLEALASSLPVVTTDSGSILEVVDDGKEGLVVEQRDSRAFAAALEKLVTDPELEQRMAKAARARFDRDFDIRVTEKRLHERIMGFLAREPVARAEQV